MLPAKVPLKDTKSVVRPLVTAILRRMLSAKKKLSSFLFTIVNAKGIPPSKSDSLDCEPATPASKSLDSVEEALTFEENMFPIRRGKTSSLGTMELDKTVQFTEFEPTVVAWRLASNPSMFPREGTNSKQREKNEKSNESWCEKRQNSGNHEGGKLDQLVSTNF